MFVGGGTSVFVAAGGGVSEGTGVLLGAGTGVFDGGGSGVLLAGGMGVLLGGKVKVGAKVDDGMKMMGVAERNHVAVGGLMIGGLNWNGVGKRVGIVPSVSERVGNCVGVTMTLPPISVNVAVGRPSSRGERSGAVASKKKPRQ